MNDQQKDQQKERCRRLLRIPVKDLTESDDHFLKSVMINDEAEFNALLEEAQKERKQWELG